MNIIYRDIFQAIHEGRWLKIEYRNCNGQVTRYWIGIRSLDPVRRTLAVDGLHLGQYTVEQYDLIYIDAIQSSQLVEGSYCPVNEALVQDISLHPHKYQFLFDNVANLKILNYLEMCSRLDTTPYDTDFKLVHFLDHESFREPVYALSQEQFTEIVQSFQRNMDRRPRADGKLVIKQLAMNVLSIHTQKGLYVLAYRKLHLDVKQRVLRPDEEITICTEFTVNGDKQSIRRYLDAEEFELLNHFDKNQEQIKDCVMRHYPAVMGVDDMPYVIGIGRDVILDLHTEYGAIIDMYHKEKVTYPIKAFFGDLLGRPRRTKAYPIALIGQNVNLDQLLAINNAMKYPLAYIQGPPGTGKTNTIINTIATAFFNGRTVLFASYNNMPVDGVFDKLANLQYHGNRIPFPVLRLGNAEKVSRAIDYIRAVYLQVQSVTIFSSTLDKRRDDQVERAKRLSQLLKKYEELLDLRERSETLNRLMEYQEHSMELLRFQTDLHGRQLAQVNERIAQIGQITDEDAEGLLDTEQEEFFQYLYYTSARYIKKLAGHQYAELLEILDMTDRQKRVDAFQKYLGKTENIKRLQKVFPVIITTCISAHRLGKPEPMFDMVIMDEASQCNTAISLVPILRGENLMLVGDPQQLNPVILLDEQTNQQLRRRYHITDEYDYRTNSIYKTYLACDSVSDEVLLRNHYRCNAKIIGFNNEKYYNSRLNICTDNREEHPLTFIDVPDSSSDLKNAAPGEVDAIVQYAKGHPDKSIAVITPFVNQRKLIEEALRREDLRHVSCGTVHAFQGDEKDVVLFSTAITERTQEGTYAWLKNNKELINVATSRARDQLIVLSDSKSLERLHAQSEDDDLYELIEYVRKNGDAQVTRKQTNSRALGVKPFSTATEEAFLLNLTHALENIMMTQGRYTIHKEVAISQVFEANDSYNDLFYTGRFDFVVYENEGKRELPLLAIELDGKEHYEDEVVRARDQKKNEICQAHNMQIIRVENSYARRYNHIKEILLDYFSRIR